MEFIVINIFKMMDVDYFKLLEGLLGVLGYMLFGKSLDLLLVVVVVIGKLKFFVWKFINLNEFIIYGSEESIKLVFVWVLLFDIFFFMLCYVV